MAWYTEITVETGEIVRNVVDFSENIATTTLAKTRSWCPSLFMSGHKLDIGPIWLRIKLGRAYRSLPDVLQIHGPWMVSERFRNILEAREPNVHQFFPVELEAAKSGAELGPRYILNVGQTLAAISVDRSKINWGVRADGSKWAYPPGAADDLVATQAAITGKSLWCDPLYPLIRFVSDDLKVALESADVHGLQYLHVREED